MGCGEDLVDTPFFAGFKNEIRKSTACIDADDYAFFHGKR
jgi:hypothetical protein